MLTFVLRKMLNNKWMMICLLIGNILLYSVVMSVPTYSDAILQRVLTRELESLQSSPSDRYPGTIELSTAYNNSSSFERYADADAQAEGFASSFGADITERVTLKTTSESRIYSALEREFSVDNPSVRLQARSDVAEHITITGGRMYSDSMDGGMIELIVNEKTMVEQDLLLGEEIKLKSLVNSSGEARSAVIVGVYKNSRESDLYWLYSPSAFSDIALVSPTVFDQVVLRNYTKSWYYFLDYSQLDAAEVNQYIDQSAVSRDYFAGQYSSGAFKVAFLSTLENFVGQKEKLTVTLWVLLVPIFTLLAFFIFMVSKQILEQEKNTIAVIKSRGAGRGQVIGIFAVQSLAIAVASLIVGVPLGMLICGFIGASDGFLGFVGRAALQVRLLPEALYYVLIAAALSMLTMIVPSFVYSRVTIVDHKRQTNKKAQRVPLAQLIASLLIVGVSLYGWFSYNNQAEYLIGNEGTAALDPLLFLSSALFIIGAGLLIAVLLPQLYRLLYALTRKRLAPELYAALLRVTRAAGDQRFIMIFLVLTVATGIFDARAARTINQNTIDNLSYSNGATVVMQEKWTDNSQSETATMLLYKEPDFDVYADFDRSHDDVKLTKVLNSTFRVSNQNVRVMGITTTEFAEVAWMRDGLLPAHWYNYLNTLASDARAVIVSSNFKELGYALGDRLWIKDANDTTFSGVIYGFFDYWPTYHDVKYTTDYLGVTTGKEQYLVVANLAQLQAVWGVTPYEIWASAKDSAVLYDFAEQNGLEYVKFVDNDADIVEAKNDPLLQGINGSLTVGFIMVLLVCMVGFLIFWILSIKSRVLQFGIFRAMGMPMAGIIRMLIGEQVLTSLVSVAAGAAVGFGASELFVPLIQLSYASTETNIPLIVVSDSSDYLRLAVVIGLMFAVCMTVLGVIIKRIKIAQALKLGED